MIVCFYSTASTFGSLNHRDIYEMYFHYNITVLNGFYCKIYLC